MGLTIEQEIDGAIDFLYHHGYIVKKDYTHLVGKWVAFMQEGMEPILHGKVRSISPDGLCTIRCKNGCRRYCEVDKILSWNDDKKDCYKFRR